MSTVRESDVERFYLHERTLISSRRAAHKLCARLFASISSFLLTLGCDIIVDVVCLMDEVAETES